MQKETQKADIPRWSTLLVEAVNKPGLIMDAYSAFWNYSVGNQILALIQCQLRGIQPGPINTFPKWQTLGRVVKRGERALTLCIERITFDKTDGNCQGFARASQIAINPVAQLPHKTLFHEIAHVLLHTSEGDFTDTEQTPRNLREVEAESVALLCCEALNLEGADYARGYIQHWLYEGIGYEADAIPEKSAQKIFRAADQILRAGRPTTERSAESAD